MLDKAMEFLRITDAQPSDEKVRKRKESAQETLSVVRTDAALVADLAQGVVSGFGSAPFSQDAASVATLIKSIKDRDTTLPQDLKENAVELRALAGIVLGELLTNHPKITPTDESVLTALCLNSALSLRPTATEKHVRWVLDTLLAAGDAVLLSAGRLRRKRGTAALQKLDALKKTEPPADPWETVIPSFRQAVQEATAQAAIDREELETLWWMFAAYSELQQKPLAKLEPFDAAFCAGIELGERALLPPSLSTIGMIRRAVESERKASTLNAVSLQDATKDCSKPMVNALAPADRRLDDTIARYPALLPLSWACRRLRDCTDGSQKLGKEFTIATGIPVNGSRAPSEWGAQVFREKILQRFLVGPEEN
jgi:GTPase-associated system helical domain